MSCLKSLSNKSPLERRTERDQRIHSHTCHGSNTNASLILGLEAIKLCHGVHIGQKPSTMTINLRRPTYIDKYYDHLYSQDDGTPNPSTQETTRHHHSIPRSATIYLNPYLTHTYLEPNLVTPTYRQQPQPAARPCTNEEHKASGYIDMTNCNFSC